ncbi:N-acetyl sugar amidotransferase [Solidesulfovibrio alcoholivorans]|uniref:N-acetyl sugar amidotransferase n=1 Tax=Solidesulfovibrio alcoholivorans TaxID=81406 RepID=UPI000B3365D4|nr:N-acetyl sugar amidotransferase [Solidesulfovibrio alcoholivorans]
MNHRGKPLFRDLRYCVRCCMPETEEGTVHDALGICRACQSSEQKMHIDWVARERQLREIFAKAKAAAGNNYDCVLPISGGKDSMFQAHVLVKVYNMKPLAVTFNHNWYSETGWYNLVNLLETFNLDHVMFTPNRDLVNRLAAKSLREIGDTCWHCHSGCGAFPLQVAVRFGIPLLVYGESASEGQGLTDYNNPIRYDREYFTKISARRTPDEMVCDTVSAKDVHPFQLPSAEECEAAGIQGMHLGDYMFWDDERHTELVRDVYGWRETQMENSYKGYKSAECVMPGMHDFTCYLKRGFGRATFQGSVDVRNGLLTREEAFDLIARTDPVRPEALDYFLEFTGLTEEEFYEIMAGLRQGKLRDADMPVLPKQAPNRERVLPFAQQLLERLRRTDTATYGTPLVAGNRAPRREPEPDLFLRRSLPELVQDLADGALTPLDLAETTIRRVEALDARFMAFEHFDAARLRAAARELTARLVPGQALRLLEGAPIGVKDAYNTEDYPTEMGSALWRGFTPGNDARLVFNLKRAGAVVAGKTVTAEFAVHALGKTVNPHDATRTPGTSSSGSAVAVALGMVPAALGTQTAGSIIRPASFCGVYGFKPSFGLLPRTGTLKTTDSLDTLGFLAARRDSLAPLFQALRVHGGNYPVSDAALSDRGRQTKPAGRPWRVALLRTHTFPGAPDYARKALLDLARALDADPDIEVVEAELPEILGRAHDIHRTIYHCSLAYYFAQESRSETDLSDVIREIIAEGRAISALDYNQALRDQETCIAAMDELMRGFDAGISLATAGEAPLRDRFELPDPALIWTLAHLPAVSAPAFVSPAGLPFGVQCVARKYNDPLLLACIDALGRKGFLPDGPSPLAPAAREDASGERA